MGKRKRSAASKSTADSEAQATPKRRRVNRKTEPAPKKAAAGVFRFMDLPGELRDNVYEKLLEGRPTRLSRNSANKTLAIESGLARTCSQIRSEMLDLALLQAPIIQTSVRNYNFSHLIAFFNRLSEAQLSKLEPTSAETTVQRIFRIKLIFSASLAIHGSRGSAFDHLVRWLNRVERPDKKGTKIDFQYRAEGCHSAWWPNRDADPSRASGRRREEARKMHKAILKGTYGKDYKQCVTWRSFRYHEDNESGEEDW